MSNTESAVGKVSTAEVNVQEAKVKKTIKGKKLVKDVALFITGLSLGATLSATELPEKNAEGVNDKDKVKNNAGKSEKEKENFDKYSLIQPNYNDTVTHGVVFNPNEESFRIKDSKQASLLMDYVSKKVNHDMKERYRTEFIYERDDFFKKAEENFEKKSILMEKLDLKSFLSTENGKNKINGYLTYQYSALENSVSSFIVLYQGLLEQQERYSAGLQIRSLADDQIRMTQEELDKEKEVAKSVMEWIIHRPELYRAWKAMEKYDQQRLELTGISGDNYYDGSDRKYLTTFRKICEEWNAKANEVASSQAYVEPSWQYAPKE